MSFTDILNKPIESLKFCVVDVETTGMYSSFNRICDLGIACVENCKITTTFNELINPDQTIPFWISKFTGLTDFDVQNKPVFNNYASYLYQTLNLNVFVGHNVGFDYSFICVEFTRSKIKFSAPKLCTVKLSRSLLPNLKSYNLDVLTDYFGIKVSRRHRAFPDAFATAEILIKLINIAKEKHNAKTLYNLTRLQKTFHPLNLPTIGQDNPLGLG